jgi:hypothetical protein
MILNKKASINQMFTFLLIAILIGLIFLFAIKWIPTLLETGCEAEKVSLVKELKDSIENSNTYGSVNEKTFYLPCEYTALCFIDKEIIGETLMSNINTVEGVGINPIIFDSISNGIEYNVFMLKGNVAEPLFFSDKLRVDGELDYLCIVPPTSKVKLKLIGEGRTTAVSDT